MKVLLELKIFFGRAKMAYESTGYRRSVLVRWFKIE